MKAGEALDVARDLLLRMLPHRGPVGLQRIGHPGRRSPVLLTANYTLTLRRLRRALRGHSVWLLAANGNGINVWCAASGGHLTHHDVIAVLRSSGIAEQVDHRELILPPFAATGVERRKVAQATGWRAKWGPARLDDLPAYLARGQRVLSRERRARFPPGERMEMALVWLLPMLALYLPVVVLAAGARAGLLAGAVLSAMVLGLFALVPWLGLGRGRRWPVFVLLGLAGALAAAGLLALASAPTWRELLAVVLASALAAVVLAVDFEGTTPLYGSVINTHGNPAHIELLEERCTGSADCVIVCPKNVFTIDGRRRKVAVARPEDCLQCGACIVQCPSDALRFRYADGSVLGPDVVRTTRLNLAGRRAVRVARD